MSYSFWKRELNGRADAVGSSLLLEGQRFTVEGVATPDFHGVASMLRWICGSLWRRCFKSGRIAGEI